MKLSQKQSKFTLDKSKLVQKAFELGIQLTDGDAFRSRSQVLLNYYGKKVVERDGILYLEDAPKVSWTKHSSHENRLAQDYNFFLVQADGNRELTNNYNDVKVLGEYWEGLDDKNKWGGFWLKSNGKPGKDIYHFEREL